MSAAGGLKRGLRRAARPLQAAAARLYERLDPPLPCPLPAGALAAVGVSDADLPRLREGGVAHE